MVGPQLALGLGAGLCAVGGPWFGLLVLAAGLVTARLGGAAGTDAIAILIPAVVAAVAVACGQGLRRVLGPQLGITRLRELALLVAILLAGAVLATALGTWVLSQSGLLAPIPRAPLFLSRLAADAFGQLVAAPVFILWAAPLYHGCNVVDFGDADRRRAWEIAAQVFAVGAAIVVGRGSPDPGLACLVAMMPVIWIGLREGLHLSALAALIVVLAERNTFGAAVPAGMVRVQDSYGIILELVALGVGTVGLSNRRLLVRLRERQATLTGVLRGSRLGMWEWSPSGQMRFDAQWLEMFGQNSDDVPDEQAWRRLVHREDLTHVLWLRDAHWKGHAPSYEAEYRIKCGDGTYRHVLDRGIVVSRGEKGEPLLMAGTCLDLSARKQAEASLMRVVGIVDQAADHVGAADLQGNILYANQALMRLRNDTDQAAACRRHISEYFPESSARTILREALPAALSRGRWEGEVELAEVSGRVIPGSLILVLHRDGEGAPQAFSFSVRDLTAAKQAEATARVARQREGRARQYESLGRFAGGVAHDFNNLLTPILGNVGMAELEVDAESAAFPFLKQIESASRRAADLCDSLQLYAGKGRGNLRPSDLNAAILAAESGLRTLAESRVEFRFDLAPDLPTVAADVAKVRHALELVVRNALETQAGRVANVRIRTTVEDVPPERLADLFTAPEFSAGRHVVLELSDDCVGMSPATLDRLLEPFFEARPGQQGMGLAVLLGIGMAHCGAVSVQSKPSEGNCFRLYFQSSDGATQGVAAEPANQEWRGAGPVLVIDDEETVRLVATNILESLGFTPLVARDGPEGVKVFRQHAAALRAVILDLTMPHMSGEQTYSEIRRVDADVPVVVMSGYSEPEMQGRFKAADPAGFLRKPFTRDMVREVLHQVLVRRG